VYNKDVWADKETGREEENQEIVSLASPSSPSQLCVSKVLGKSQEKDKEKDTGNVYNRVAKKGRTHGK